MNENRMKDTWTERKKKRKEGWMNKNMEGKMSERNKWAKRERKKKIKKDG